MATSSASAGTPATSKSNRGKDQIQWSEGVWQAIDSAVTEEITRTRVTAKFLQQVHVHKKRTNVESDKVVIPQPTVVAAAGGVAATTVPPADTALSVDETDTTRIQEYWTTFKLSVAQVEAEENQEDELNKQSDSTAPQTPAATGTTGQPAMKHSHRASTAVSLALRTSNILAQAEDLILLNGQNAYVNSPLFVNQQVTVLDPNLASNLDTGLLNIQSQTAPSVPATKPQTGTSNVILLPAGQVIAVHPAPLPAGTPTPPNTAIPRYAENTLNAVAQGFSILQGLGHYENYALVLHTIPYADLHQALPTTLIEPVEPVSHLIKAGIYGTGTLPPFSPIVLPTPTPAGGGSPGQAPATGLPTFIATPSGSATLTVPLSDSANGVAGFAATNSVLYTGVLVSLSGNTMDQVRGLMDDLMDVAVTFNQKDANESYRFRVVQRFALRLKDATAVILFLFLDS